MAAKPKKAAGAKASGGTNGWRLARNMKPPDDQAQG
jgi:hypothetical protein